MQSPNRFRACITLVWYAIVGVLLIPVAAVYGLCSTIFKSVAAYLPFLVDELGEEYPMLWSDIVSEARTVAGK